MNKDMKKSVKAFWYFFASLELHIMFIIIVNSKIHP